MNSSMQNSYAAFQVNCIRFSHTMTVDDYSFIHEGLTMESNFSCSDKNNTTYSLKLRLCSSKHYLQIFLNSLNRNNIYVKLKCFLVDTKGNNGFETEYNSTRICSSDTISFDKFIPHNQLNSAQNQINYYPDDRLTIKCEGTIAAGCTQIHVPCKRLPYQIPEYQHRENFGALLSNAKLSDVTLIVGDHEFKAHKLVLVAQSPVFAAMFEHDMAERQNKTVKITDIAPEAIEEMLHFLYTGESPSLDKLAEQLLEAADKYALEQLKAMCEKSLGSQVSIETAADILLLADRHSALQLKTHVVEFIKDNSEKGANTAGCNFKPQDLFMFDFKTFLIILLSLSLFFLCFYNLILEKRIL